MIESNYEEWSWIPHVETFLKKIKKRKAKKKKIQRRLSISRRVDLLIRRLKAINMY